MDDHSLMPFGIHKGKKLANVPKEYLVFLYENNRCGKQLRTYIRESIIQYQKK